MRITGTIVCYDRPDQNQILTESGQTATIACLDSTDQFYSFGFQIRSTFWTTIDTTFIQNMELAIPSPLSLTLLDRRYQGWNNVDGTFVDGTYTEPRLYDPAWVSYGLYKNSSDGSSWALQGYRFREPRHENVGQFFATMILPSDVGKYRLEWLYQKDRSSDFTTVNQIFNVTYWGNNPYYGYFVVPPSDGTALAGASPFPQFTADFGDWISSDWGIRWPQYLW
jgi:hypothetical protein